jgi:hypothetical protein
MSEWITMWLVLGVVAALVPVLAIIANQVRVWRERRALDALAKTLERRVIRKRAIREELVRRNWEAFHGPTEVEK